MRHIALASAALYTIVSLTGCKSIDPFTGEEGLSNQTQISIAGAVVGGILGAGLSKEDRKRGAIIGAGIGAISGAVAGHYMDKQEAELRQKLQSTGVSVTRNGDNLILNMPGNITFDTGRSDLKNDFEETLNSVVLVLNEYESTLITVEGHTDSTGDAAYNQQLSEQRALAVGQYLVNKKVNQARVAAVGYGETRPIASNASVEGRATNRRVELRLEPLVQE